MLDEEIGKVNEQQVGRDLNWITELPSGRQEMQMVGIGNNKSNISAIAPDSDERSITDIGEGLGVSGAEVQEESK